MDCKELFSGAFLGHNSRETGLELAEVRLRILCDKRETARACWPGWDPERAVAVNVAAPLARLSGIDPGQDARLLELGERPAAPRWNLCLLADRPAQSQYDLLRQGPRPEGNMACLALSGDRCHGQNDRPWQALPGNLHLCLGMEIDLPAAQYSRALIMLPAVAVSDILLAAGIPPDRCGIKWVNDILLDGHKTAGVLTSSRTTAGRLDSVVFGIGLNVAATPAGEGMTCLAEHLPRPLPALGEFLERFLDVVDARLDQLASRGPAHLVEIYRARSLVLGRMVTIWPEGVALPAGQTPLFRGRVLEILPDLSLRLEGVPEPVAQGRLVMDPDRARG